MPIEPYALLLNRVTVLTQVTLHFSMVADASLGQLTFEYNVTVDGEPYSPVGGLPAPPIPSPNNSAPVRVV